MTRCSSTPRRPSWRASWATPAAQPLREQPRRRGAHRGEYERARELFEESLAIGRERQDQDLLGALTNLGFTTLMLDDVQRARPLLRESLVAAREMGSWTDIVGFVGLGAAYAREDPARAARLIGRADKLFEEAAQTSSSWRVVFATRRKQRSGRGWGGRLRSGVRGGRALALEDALALALRPD